MYHIWPSHGQTHLFDGQDRDDTARGLLAFDGQKLAIETAATVGGRIAAMGEHMDGAFDQFTVDLLKAYEHRASLIGQRERLANATLHQVFDAVR